MNTDGTSEQQYSVAALEPDWEQIERLQKEKPEVQWFDFSGNFPEPPAGQDPGNMDAVIVFSRTHEEKHALALCKAVRESSAYEGTPLLVAITIYQMILGNTVKKELQNASFIFTPIDSKDLVNTVAEMNEPATSREDATPTAEMNG